MANKHTDSYKLTPDYLNTFFTAKYNDEMLRNNLRNNLPFKRQPHIMVKHTQTIRRQLPTNCLSVFDHFVGLALKVLS